MPRRVYVAEAEIDAPPAAVWAVLSDVAAYRAWNPFTPECVTSLEVGQPVDMRVRMAKLGFSVQQRETVRAVEPARRLVWGMRMLGGLVEAERTQTLSELDDGRTLYRTEDVIEGALGPLVFLLFGPSIQVGFDGVASALKARVESLRESR